MGNALVELTAENGLRKSVEVLNMDVKRTQLNFK